MIAHSTVVFVFATSMEADPFITIVDAELTTKEPCLIYQATVSDQPIMITVTGMGMAAARATMAFIIENYAVNMIFNCGVAGSLVDDFVVGDIVNISQSRAYQAGEINTDSCHLSAHSFMLKGYKEGVLLTTDQPVFDLQKKRMLSNVAQLVDMEGDTIARLCEQHNIPLQLIKIISDSAIDRNQLKMNLSNMSEILAHRILTDINQLFSKEMTA